MGVPPLWFWVIGRDRRHRGRHVVCCGSSSSSCCSYRCCCCYIPSVVATVLGFDPKVVARWIVLPVGVVGCVLLFLCENDISWNEREVYGAGSVFSQS
jgi:hypothetical protein